MEVNGTIMIVYICTFRVLVSTASAPLFRFDSFHISYCISISQSDFDFLYKPDVPRLAPPIYVTLLH